ncbi:unnamed protein product [Paramecium sonneborni]|uniref:Uncharacterized protein n=1 Tax=Paramecium sonneborni TaxID=65129 RepID=A0A8S1QLF7_9CILI|nr:unnamed protein product [Paramecium sonneborni]
MRRSDSIADQIALEQKQIHVYQYQHNLQVSKLHNKFQYLICHYLKDQYLNIKYLYLTKTPFQIHLVKQRNGQNKYTNNDQSLIDINAQQLSILGQKLERKFNFKQQLQKNINQSKVMKELFKVFNEQKKLKINQIINSKKGLIQIQINQQKEVKKLYDKETIKKEIQKLLKKQIMQFIYQQYLQNILQQFMRNSESFLKSDGGLQQLTKMKNKQLKESQRIKGIIVTQDLISSRIILDEEIKNQQSFEDYKKQTIRKRKQKKLLEEPFNYRINPKNFRYKSNKSIYKYNDWENLQRKIIYFYRYIQKRAFQKRRERINLINKEQEFLGGK